MPNAKPLSQRDRNAAGFFDVPPPLPAAKMRRPKIDRVIWRPFAKLTAKAVRT